MWNISFIRPLVAKCEHCSNLSVFPLTVIYSMNKCLDRLANKILESMKSVEDGAFKSFKGVQLSVGEEERSQKIFT